MDHGYAQCKSWDVVSSIRGLPVCTTKITFSLIPNTSDKKRYQVRISLTDIDFTHLSNLTELLVFTDHRYYDRLSLRVQKSASLLSLESLRSLQLKVMHGLIRELPIHDVDMFSNLKHLEVLDLTRAKRIELSNINYLLGKKLTMTTLVLKHIQDIRWQQIYAPTLDLAHFICGTNVRFRDLSYNDITYVNMTKKNCKSKVRYLNLDHNIIASFYHDEDNFLTLLTMLGSLETLIAGSSYKSATYDESLWTDRYLYINDTENNEEDNGRKSPFSILLQQSPLASFTVYDNQLKDILRHCGHLDYVDIMRCFRHSHDDLCDIVQCLSPRIDIEACPKNYLSDKLKYFAQRICHYDSCLYNVPLPFPPKLKSFTFSNTSPKRPSGHSIGNSNFTNICFHPDNSLEYVDISFSDLSQIQDLPGLLTISGFHNLKYLNMQGC